jgi:two-component system response regulator PilR (NtrC family)
MAHSPRLLVVDDEPDLRTLYELSLLKIGYAVDAVADLASARQCLAQERYDLLIIDMRLPDGMGLELVRELRQAHRPEKSMVITAYGSAENAVEALKAGAFDYLTKPVDPVQLRSAVANALRDGQAPRPAPTDGPGQGSPHHSPADPSLALIVGSSAGMQKVREQIQRMAHSMAPVLVQGESGTGKELVAKAIHACGHRSAGPLVAVNCGAIPESLMEAEFFGVRKGAYTGATADRIGYFQAASGGTLFLDEIGDLPLPMQAKLLRAIQERQVRPLGSTQEEATDVRLISATHHDLPRAVQEGRFRQDLFYRINVIEIAMPPLRDRIDDMPELIDNLLQRLAQRNGLPTTPRLDREALQKLGPYPFPGNVRELENILERAMALHPGPVLGVEAIHLAPIECEPPGFNGRVAGPPLPAKAGMHHALSDDAPTREHLEHLLQTHRWNQSQTARELGWTLSKLRYWMQRLGLE